MCNLIRKLLNRETFLYLLCGVLTTAVNFFIYELGIFMGMNYKSSTVIAWIAAVIFAYITNKIFVFNRKDYHISILLKEFGVFTASRMVSGLADLLFMIAAVDYLKINDSLGKLLSNIFVVIINYLFSKFIVFKKVEEERNL